MRLILILIFLFAVSLNAQSSDLIMLFSGAAAEWKPTDVDGNTLAYYDGDIGLTTSGWEDQFSTHDIVFSNSPTITADATPNRDAVLFNGTNQSGTVVTPTKTQPYTLYIVFKHITWTNTDRIFDDGATDANSILYQSSSTPILKSYAGANLQMSPNLALGTYGIVTCVWDGVNSEVRINLETAVTGDGGALDGAGITLAVDQAVAGRFAHCEIAYLIIRSGADNTATQNIIIGELATLTGITL